MPNCKNCQVEVNQKFCPNCGQPALVKRIDSHYIQHEFLHLFHIEKGFLYTIKELFFRPGHAVREYLQGNRARLMKPVPFAIFCGLIFTILFKISNLGSFGKNAFSKIIKNEHTLKIMAWLDSHHAYGNFLLCILTALLSYLLFRKHKYNFYEILVLMIYVSAQNAMYIGILSILNIFFGMQVFSNVFSIFSIIYIVWAIGQFFDYKRFSSYFKALFAYVLGSLVFTVLIVFIGYLINYLQNKQ